MRAQYDRIDLLIWEKKKIVRSNSPRRYYSRDARRLTILLKSKFKTIRDRTSSELFITEVQHLADKCIFGIVFRRLIHESEYYRNGFYDVKQLVRGGGRGGGGCVGFDVYYSRVQQTNNILYKHVAVCGKR